MQGDLASAFFYRDVLCVRCRDALGLRRRNFQIGGLAVRSYYPYAGMARELLIQYKELYDEALYPALIWPLAPEIRREYRGWALVPLPSAPALTKARGFAAAARLFEPAGLPLWELLEKDDTEQKRLTRQERYRAARRIRLREAARVPNAPLLLVDDVVTTGASLAAAYQIFRNHPYPVRALALLAHESFYRTENSSKKRLHSWLMKL